LLAGDALNTWGSKASPHRPKTQKPPASPTESPFRSDTPLARATAKKRSGQHRRRLPPVGQRPRRARQTAKPGSTAAVSTRRQKEKQKRAIAAWTNWG